MLYHMVMGRKEVLVQLDDDLVQRLDQLAAKQATNRSELLRRGAAALLEAADQPDADRVLQEAYAESPRTPPLSLRPPDLLPPPPRSGDPRRYRSDAVWSVVSVTGTARRGGGVDDEDLPYHRSGVRHPGPPRVSSDRLRRPPARVPACCTRQHCCAR